MRDDELVAAARRRGVSSEWRDWRGETRQVSPAVLRRVLAALQEDDGSETGPPSLLVGRSGEPIALPPGAGRAGERVELQAASGERHDFVLSDCGSHCTVPAPAVPGYYTLALPAGGELRMAIAPTATVARAALSRHRDWVLALQLYGLRRAGDGGLGSYAALETLAGSAAAGGAQGLAVSPVHAAFSADAGHYSPYSPSSRLLYNAMYVDPLTALTEGAPPARMREWAVELGIATEMERLEQLRLIDWRAAWPLRQQLLRRLHQRFRERPPSASLQHDYDEFVRRGGDVLLNHARFEMLHARQFGADPNQWHWRQWPAALRNPDSAGVRDAALAHADEVAFHLFLQWLADRGLGRAQTAARHGGMGLGLIADLAIGSCSGGSQSWSCRDDMLDGLSLGAPPDMFNPNGQSWGLVTFSPAGLRRHGYAPFIDMVRAALRHAGGARIDHILGLQRLWVVPDGCDASEGAYLAYPFEALARLLSLEAWRHRALIIGEDLGTVPEGFRDALHEHGVLGMEVLWFEREAGYFIDPSRWSDTAAAMTTTHDLPTVAGWWQGVDLAWRERLGRSEDAAADRDQRQQDRQALWNAFSHAGIVAGDAPAPAGPVVDAALAFVARTPAPLVLVPLEDLLGEAEQPNLPATIDEHPNWCRRLAEPAETLLQPPPVQDRLALLRGIRPSA